MRPPKRANSKARNVGACNVAPEYIEMVRDYHKLEKRTAAKREPLDEIPSSSPKRQRPVEGFDQLEAPKVTIAEPEAGPVTETTLKPESSPVEFSDLGSGPGSGPASGSWSGSDSEEDDWEGVEISSIAPDSPDSPGSPDLGQDHDQSPESDGDVINVTLGEPTRDNSNAIEKVSRPARIEIHKFCLVAWMLFSFTRNRWISARVIRHSELRNFLESWILQELFPQGDHFTPFMRSRKLIDGLRHAMSRWQHRFKVTGDGIGENPMNGGDCKLGQKEYTKHLLEMKGSSDMMAVGFCALMRSVGLKARLVCSLQPPDIYGPDLQTTKPRKAARKTAPIFWTEVYDSGAKGWVAVDPTTSTIKPVSRTKSHSNFEPPVTSTTNIMRYCIAWDSRDNARDVTRRYASQYNGRTRKKRITNFPDGEKWYNELLAKFSTKRYDDPDIIEIKELYSYETCEGLPSRVQDFINHPMYVLQSQLHKNQIISDSSRPCGTLSVKNSPPLPVFRRSQVQTCRSAQSWYRRGFKVIEGAQPRLHKQIRGRMSSELENVALYSPEDVELYVPPPVGSDGAVPKSEYRTIDLFVRTMLPKGAVHVTHPRAQYAAKVLGIDFANAVTNVKFSRRGINSVVNGIVISKDFHSAIVTTLQHMDVYEEEQRLLQHRIRTLMLWRKYIVAIQIWERIERMNPDPNKMYEQRAPRAIENTENTSEVADLSASSELDSEDEYHWEPQPSDDSDDELNRPIETGSRSSPSSPNTAAQPRDVCEPQANHELSSCHDRPMPDSRLLSIRVPMYVGRSLPATRSPPIGQPSIKSHQPETPVNNGSVSGDSESDFPEILDELSESELATL